LMGVAGFLGFESKGLLIGEGASVETLDSIRALAEAEPNVKEVKNLLTMYFGPRTVLLTLDVAFAAGVAASERTSAVAHLERCIRGRHPAIKHVFIEARSLETSLPS
ncbi:MAG: cation transporter, partial [Acidobacteriota bacterium]|nr:cation transporter [Acidobacteriota bacterium]